MNATTTYIYIVHSDINENNIYAEFTDEQAAIEYARKNAAELTYVDKVEVLLDDDGEVEDEFGSETIWVYSDEETATESEEDYWDDLATMYDEEEAGKHDLGDTTWFESVNAAELVETLEENEDEVECKECFDLFPKADCIKVDLGYICPTCAEGGTVSEDEIFKIDFPEYEKFSDGNAMVPEEPAISVESEDETPIQDPQEETIPISTPEEAVPYLVTDERDAVAGYEKAAEIVAESDLENKEEILDTIEHIKEEEEEHIEELTDLIDTKEAEVPEDETDPVSEDEVEEIEDPEATEPAALVEDAGIKTWICWYEGNDIGTVEAASEEEAAELMMTTYPEYQYNNTDWSVELAEESSLTEHVNEEHPAVESDQELSGVDNAVVDCKVADVVTHSEDEKPVDCEGEKKPLEKPLTESKRDPFHEAIFEAIDYLTEFSDIFPVPENIGAATWEELKDDINYGLSSDFEIAEIIMEYFQKDLAIGEKHPEIFEDDPQSELTLETYNRLKKAYDKAVEDYKAKYPEDFEEQLDLTHGYDHIKSVATLVHQAVDNYTKENRVGIRPSGTAIYVIGAKSSSDPEKMKKLILDTLAENGYEPEVVEYLEGGNAYGYSVDKIKTTARMNMSYQKREGLVEDVTDEILATNKKGDYLVKNSSGYGYSVFSNHNVWIGSFECDSDEKAVNRFNRGDINESVKTNGAHEDIAFFANEIDAHFDKKYEIELLDGYKIHFVGETNDMTNEINSVKNIVANNLEADSEKLSDGTYVYMLKKKAAVTAEALTEDGLEGETEDEPLSNDPAEKPSKNVKMANTASTSGMDFETACKTFGINLED